MTEDIRVDNEIDMTLHCKECLDQRKQSHLFKMGWTFNGDLRIQCAVCKEPHFIFKIKQSDIERWKDENK